MSDPGLSFHYCPRLERARRPAPRPPLIIMPAMPPLGLMDAVARRLDNYRCRRQLKRLLRLDDRMLSDIGHDRAVIESVLHADHSRNPCLTLTQCARHAGCSRPG